jgi:hypothetical protein
VAQECAKENLNVRSVLNGDSLPMNLGNSEPKQKREICRDFRNGQCKRGDGCKYQHVDVGNRSSGVKPRVCRYFNNGGCRKGSHCEFLHQESEGSDHYPSCRDKPKWSNFKGFTCAHCGERACTLCETSCDYCDGSKCRNFCGSCPDE